MPQTTFTNVDINEEFQVEANDLTYTKVDAVHCTVEDDPTPCVIDADFVVYVRDRVLWTDDASYAAYQARS